MGIRVHKAIGYSTMVPHPDYEKLTKLFNSEKKNEIADTIRSSGKLHTYDTGHPDCPLYGQEQNSYPSELYEVVKDTSYDSDNTGIIIIIPPAFYKDWCRTDDAIDYYAERARNLDESVDHFEQLNCALYPYSGWITKSGEKIDESIHRITASDDDIPMIPECVQVIADYIGLNWLDLRPVIATWWG